MTWNSYGYDYAYQTGAEDGYQYLGKLVSIDELQKIYVEVKGEGPPIVFIPGFGGDASIFLNLADVLSDEFTVITYDRRGNSRSERGWVRVTREEQADDIAKLLDALKIKRSLIMSQSNGGAVACTYLLRHRERVLGAILHEPFWSPQFLSNPSSVRDQVDANIRIVQHRREKDCGELEGRLRYLGGDNYIELFSAQSRLRIAENFETGTLEREVFAQWFPTDQEWNLLAQIPKALLLGDDTIPFFKEAVHGIEKKLKAEAIKVPGGHGGFVEFAEEIGEIVRPIFRKFSERG